jgi:hypothetical protein
MRIALKRAKHFITCNGKFYGAKETAIRGLLTEAEHTDSAVQTSLFDNGSNDFLLHSTPQNALISLTGQL